MARRTANSQVGCHRNEAAFPYRVYDYARVPAMASRSRPGAASEVSRHLADTPLRILFVHVAPSWSRAALEGFGLKIVTATFSALAMTFVVLGVAHAQSPGPAPDLLTAHLRHPAMRTPMQSRLADRPLNLTRHSAVFDVAYANPGPARIPGIARTSVDRKLASDDVTGSLGFLCGLEPGSGKQGVAAARGYDPSGRFVGAKLKFAFR